MKKTIASLLSFPLLCAINILTMIYGWGVHPQSWFWIICGFIAAMILGMLIGLASDKTD